MKIQRNKVLVTTVLILRTVLYQELCASAVQTLKRNKRPAFNKHFLPTPFLTFRRTLLESASK